MHCFALILHLHPFLWVLSSKFNFLQPWSCFLKKKLLLLFSPIIYGLASPHDVPWLLHSSVCYEKHHLSSYLCTLTFPPTSRCVSSSSIVLASTKLTMKVIRPLTWLWRARNQMWSHCKYLFIWDRCKSRCVRSFTALLVRHLILCICLQLFYEINKEKNNLETKWGESEYLEAL